MPAIRGIYVITDEALVPSRTHEEIVRAALAGGASVIQLRDKHASDDYLVSAGRDIRRLTSSAGALFIVDDRLDVAIACDADGLHVGQDDRPACELRSMLPGKILGVSVATPEQAICALEDGADYLGVGPIFGTATKADARPSVGTAQVALMRSATGGRLPIVAIGGINESNIAEVARAGADAAAIISAVACAEDMVEATRRLVHVWKSAVEGTPSTPRDVISNPEALL